MRPPEEEIRRLVAEWIKKADLDFSTSLWLSAEPEFRDIVVFHAQQAVEKYLKALLTRHQTEFPKTHVIRRLLLLLQPVEPTLASALEDANWLSPFGVDIRYPADFPETLPGDEARALEVAGRVKNAVMTVLNPYVSRA
jgi:HEPN domain-containing protein